MPIPTILPLLVDGHRFIRFITHVNGSTSSNPGQSGWGAHICGNNIDFPQGPSAQPQIERFEAWRSGPLGDCTSSAAEYLSVLEALHAMWGLAADRGIPARSVVAHVYVDSLLVALQARGDYVVRNRALKPLAVALQAISNAFHDVKIGYVGRELSVDADRLANRGCMAQPGAFEAGDAHVGLFRPSMLGLLHVCVNGVLTVASSGLEAAGADGNVYIDAAFALSVQTEDGEDSSLMHGMWPQRAVRLVDSLGGHMAVIGTVQLELDVTPWNHACHAVSNTVSANVVVGLPVPLHLSAVSAQAGFRNAVTHVRNELVSFKMQNVSAQFHNHKYWVELQRGVVDMTAFMA